MDLERARLFRDIAQSHSVSKGARLNDISQSAASQHLQELEEQLGIPLLDRSTRPLTVTEAGKLYLEMCRDVLRRQDEFQAALERMKAEVEGTVRVASIYSVGLSEMSQLEQEFSRRYPEAHLNVEYLRPEKVYEAVVTDRADLGSRQTGPRLLGVQRHGPAIDHGTRHAARQRLQPGGPLLLRSVASIAHRVGARAQHFDRDPVQVLAICSYRSPNY